MIESDIEIILDREEYKRLRYRVDKAAGVVNEASKLLSLNQHATVDLLKALRDLTLVVKTLQDVIEVLERK